MGLPPDQKARLEAEDERDRTWWLAKEESSTSVTDATGTEDTFLPRQSGTQEWKEQRGEAGK